VTGKGEAGLLGGRLGYWKVAGLLGRRLGYREGGWVTGSKAGLFGVRLAYWDEG
jgi:hypothetical protein